MSAVNSLGANAGIQNTQKKAGQKLSESKNDKPGVTPPTNHPAPPTSEKLDKTV